VAAAVAAAVVITLLPDLGRLDAGVLVLDARFVAVNVALALVAVIDGALAPPPASFTVTRHHSRTVTLGEQSPLSWEVTPPPDSRLLGASRIVSLADEVAPSLQATARRVQIPVRSRSTSRTTVRFRPRRRGRFEPRELVVRTSGPLGLVRRQRRRTVESTLDVLPPFRSAKEAELSLRRARILEVGLRSARGRGAGTEFDSLRELTPDDETRRIDWAATARSARPIVRTYRAERNQTVLCLLDSGRTMAGRVQGVPRMEHATDGAMLLAELATGLGDRMGLVAFDQDVGAVVEPSNRRSQRARLAEALFAVEPALTESSYHDAVAYVLAHQRRRSFLVLLTELGEETVERFLLPSLPLLSRTHVVVVAAVRDPDLVEWSTSTAADVDGAFLRAAAITALDRREALAARIRGLGVVVIDVEPERFASVLGDAYLEAKATARL
jgi:uncharacterized protein (DUF58 family)